jgi:hypothetical protein
MRIRQPGERGGRRERLRLSVDLLEDRTAPATFSVTNALDPRGVLLRGSLRWAVAQANLPRNNGATIAITPAVQNAITLRAGQIPIRSSVTIENQSGRPLAIRQMSPISRIFQVVNNPRTTAVTITGLGAGSPLTLTGGRVRNGNGGAIFVANPRNILTLSYIDVVGNSAAQVARSRTGTNGNGGGIYSSGTVTLNNTTVARNSANGPNSAAGHAGGIYTDQGVTLIASHVDSNTARNAGGILNVFGSIEVLDGSTVSGNASYGSSFDKGDLGGGGVGEMVGNVIVSGSQVNNNTAQGMYSAGIVSLLGGVTVTGGSEVDGNSADGPGGGIAANFQGAVTISGGSQVDGNTGAGLGGGIVNFSETYGINVIGQSQVASNALTNGEQAAVTSGLVSVGTQPKVERAFLSGGRGDAKLQSALQLFVNACAQRASAIEQAASAFPSGGLIQVGAGICSALAGPIVIAGGSAVDGNRFITTQTAISATGDGGGLFANLGSVTIDDSTISDNTATDSGGGLLANLGPITIDDSTIGSNSAGSDGGGIWNGTSLSITTSAVIQNQAGAHGGGIFNSGRFATSDTTVSGNTPDNIFPSSA